MSVQLRYFDICADKICTDFRLVSNRQYELSAKPIFGLIDLNEPKKKRTSQERVHYLTYNAKMKKQFELQLRRVL